MEMNEVLYFFSFPITIISPLAFFCRRCQFLVKLMKTLNTCSRGFRLQLISSFGFALWKFWQNFQDLNFTMMSLTFFQRFCLFRFSKFYECNQHFLLGMEGSLHNCSFLIVFINRMKESFNQNRHFSTLLGRHYPRSSGFPNWKHSIQKFHDVHSTLLKIDFFSAF